MSLVSDLPSVDLDKSILHECQLKVYTENKRLTAKGLSIEYSIPRKAAAELLEALPYIDVSVERTYEIVRLVLEKKENKYVAKLQKFVETINKDSKRQESGSPIHSIGLVTTGGNSSLLSDHIQTISLLLDDKDSILDPTIVCDMIEPAVGIQKIDQEHLREERVKNNDLAKTVVNAASVRESGNKSKTSSADSLKKPTSAASFFNASARVGAPDKFSSTKETKEDKNSHKEIKESPKIMVKENIPKPSISKETVSKSSTSPPNNKKRGNADDFVGDVEEDEEFLKEDNERMKRNKKRMVDSAKARRNQEVELKSSTHDSEVQNDDNDDDDDDDAVATDSCHTTKNSESGRKVRGAMDNFARKRGTDEEESKVAQQGKTKRVQSLEEKTFVDENGFFRTEMVRVWKTIEDEEEEKEERHEKTGNKESSSLPKKHTSDSESMKSKNPKNMKQQGLMGYFSKR